MELKLLHMYHDVMDLYGDKGNIRSFQYRCEQRGIDFVYDTCGIGEEKPFWDFDLVFMGGGADLEQLILSKDLLTKREGLKKAYEEKTFFLLICGAYQLFGRYYVNAEGEKIPGLGFFDYVTEPAQNHQRCIGNIYLEVKAGENHFDVLGFENHGGQTRGAGVEERPFGTVLFGNGNHYGSKEEGYMEETVIGTYVHGPLLPKNPELADYIITRALAKRYGAVNLQPLDDSIEIMAKHELLNNLGKDRVAL